MKEVLSIEEVKSNRRIIGECRDFYGIINSLNKFGSYCNTEVFKFLFGEEEGVRLWELFVYSCDRNIMKFYTENYMNNDQLLYLSYNIIENEEYMRMVI